MYELGYLSYAHTASNNRLRLSLLSREILSGSHPLQSRGSLFASQECAVGQFHDASCWLWPWPNPNLGEIVTAHYKIDKIIHPNV